MTSHPQHIYLDYNATAPLRAEAALAIRGVLNGPANPSSVHYFGREARAQLEHARKQIASFLDVSVSDLVFTSGGTEANNMVLSGYQKVIVSAVEHDAVLAARPDADLINVDRNGVTDLVHLNELLSGLCDEHRQSCLVSVMAANNETGVIQPLAEIAALCAEYQVHFHSDMVQAAGKMPLPPGQLPGLHFASFSAHKIGGPTGIGALWCAPGYRPSAFIRGGGQEQGRRSGTENLIGAAGFGAAAEAAQDSAEMRIRLGDYQRQFEQAVTQACPEIEVIGAGADRLVNTSALYLPGMSSELAVMSLDIKGVSVSAGSACSSGKIKPSHVITAMGQAEKAPHVIRVSSGWKTTASEMMALADHIIEMYKHSRTTK